MKKIVYTGMAVVMALGVAGCASAPQAKETSKPQNTTALEKKPVLFGKKEVKSIELQNLKQKEAAKPADDATVQALVAAIENGKLVKLILNTQTKKNITSHLTISYKDGSSDTYFVWLDSPSTVTVAKSTDAARTEGYQLKKEDAEQAVTFLETSTSSKISRQLSVDIEQIRAQDVTHMYISSAGKKKELATAQKEQIVKLYNEADVYKLYTGPMPKGGIQLEIKLKSGQSIILYSNQDGFLANTGRIFYTAKQPDFHLDEMVKQAK